MNDNDYKICPFCKSRLYLKGNHCYHCGKKLPNGFFNFFEEKNGNKRGKIEFCPNCGCKMIEGRERCGACGKDYEKLGVSHIIAILLVLMIVFAVVLENRGWVLFIIWVIGGIKYTKGNVVRINNVGMVKESNGWPEYCFITIIIIAIFTGIYTWL